MTWKNYHSQDDMSSFFDYLEEKYKGMIQISNSWIPLSIFYWIVFKGLLNQDIYKSSVYITHIRDDNLVINRLKSTSIQYLNLFLY